MYNNSERDSIRLHLEGMIGGREYGFNDCFPFFPCPYLCLWNFDENNSVWNVKQTVHAITGLHSIAGIVSRPGTYEDYLRDDRISIRNVDHESNSHQKWYECHNAPSIERSIPIPNCNSEVGTDFNMRWSDVVHLRPNNTYRKFDILGMNNIWA